MSGLFGSFNTAVTGLSANQAGLQTTSHNINNINTKGFHRQRVEMKAEKAYDMPGIGQLGMGVKVDAVVRLVDDFVNLQLRNENSTMSEYVAKNDVMGQIESIFNEPSDTGLNFAMGEMFNSWQELSKTPESLNAKSIVVEKAKTFTDTLNHMVGKISDLKSDTANNIEKGVLDFNSLVKQLNTVNDQIFNVTVKGQSPNDLMDQRDLLLKQMSGLANIKSDYDSYGKAEVTLNGKTVVGKDNIETLSTIKDIEKISEDKYKVTIYENGDKGKPKILTFEKGDVDFDKNVELLKGLKPGDTIFYHDEVNTTIIEKSEITSGKIGGYQASLKDTESRLSELMKFAEGTKMMFNKIHNIGVDGKDFFTYKPGAKFGLEVNPDVAKDVNLVQTKKNSLSSEGDGSRALAMANLRLAKINFNDLKDEDLPTFDIGSSSDSINFGSNATGQTMEGSYGDVVTKVGISVQQSSNMMANQDAVMGQLHNRRESISGVNLDEEVTNLLKYQRSYEANSRVINTINEMLDTLINRTGI